MTHQERSYNMEEFNCEWHCPICFSSKNELFLPLYGVPVITNAVYTCTNEALQAPRGDMKLVVCLVCGHIYNTAFNSALLDYHQEYENTQSFSPLFFNYLESLAEELVRRYNLIQRDVIAVGCGRGSFLELLCKLGNNRGVGFEPSFVLDKIENTRPDQITYIRDYYTHSSADYPVDLLVCRHVLEHIYDVQEFLHDICQVIGDRKPVVYFEVPNVMSYFSNQDSFAFIYEHPSYFSHHSLFELFSRCQFKVLSLDERFEGQFLSIEAIPGSGPIESKREFFKGADEILTKAIHFADSFWKKVGQWKEKLDSFKRSGQKTVIWGTGSRGVNFLNLVDKDLVVEYAIDINQFKHGNYVAGTGQKIMPPEFLREYRPDKVIVMNPIYLEEIREKIQSLKVNSEIISF